MSFKEGNAVVKMSVRADDDNDEESEVESEDENVVSFKEPSSEVEEFPESEGHEIEDNDVDEIQHESQLSGDEQKR